MKTIWCTSLAGLFGLAACLLAGCGRGASVAPVDTVAPVAVTAVPVVQRPVVRTWRATGSLIAEEEAEVAAEVGGRVVATPVERGSHVAEGETLVRLSATEAEASAREAEANVAQLEARLALEAGRPFDVDRVAEVAAARAASELAQSDFARIRTLLEQRVVSQAEYDQRRTQVEATRHQYEAARNAARQLHRQYEAAGARLVLARKALADTTVRAPFAGQVVERKVSVGDYVTRGTKVATLVQITPLRAELTVPEQRLSAVRAGQPLTLQVDAYPGRQFGGTVRFVSPTIRADTRALTLEAVVPNTDGALRPGLFATAQIQSAVTEMVRMVPVAAVRTDGAVSRLFVVHGDRVEERVVRTGQVDGAFVEIAAGLSDGDRVAVGDVARLTDGARIRLADAPSLR